MGRNADAGNDYEVEVGGEPEMEKRRMGYVKPEM